MGFFGCYYLTSLSPRRCIVRQYNHDVCECLSPAVSDGKAAAVNGACPGSKTQHSHDEGPDELVGRISHWSSVPQHPCVVHKTLNVLRKGQRGQGIACLLGEWQHMEIRPEIYSNCVQTHTHKFSCMLCTQLIEILPLPEKRWQKLESHTETIPQSPGPASADTASSTAAGM